MKHFNLKYTEDYCQKVEDLMSSGMSITEVASTLGIHRDTIYDWSKKFPEFKQAMRNGVALSQAWWERQARLNIDKKEFNHRLWEFNMKCRFKEDWSVTQNHDVNMSVSSASTIEKAEMRIEEAKKAVKVSRKSEPTITIDQIMTDSVLQLEDN